MRRSFSVRLAKESSTTADNAAPPVTIPRRFNFTIAPVMLHVHDPVTRPCQRFLFLMAFNTADHVPPNPHPLDLPRRIIHPLFPPPRIFIFRFLLSRLVSFFFSSPLSLMSFFDTMGPSLLFPPRETLFRATASPPCAPTAYELPAAVSTACWQRASL
jgi:hypothetical protein